MGPNDVWAMDLWACANDVRLDSSCPGKPTDNAFIESFNGRFQAKCLNAHWFMSLAVAAEKIEVWRRDYNEERSHGAIGNKVLAELMKSARASKIAGLIKSAKTLITAEGTLGSISTSVIDFSLSLASVEPNLQCSDYSDVPFNW